MSVDPSRRPAPGQRLLFRWRKWDGTPHWEHDCVYLGADRWGDWVGQPIGWRSARPGRELITGGRVVTLIPVDRCWTLTVNTAPPARYGVYIDLAWDVRWRDGAPSAVDMDLDVVRAADGRIWIDDRDEWDRHRVRYGYPADVVTAVDDAATGLERRLRAGDPPFDTATAQHWRRRLARLRPEPAA